MSKSLDVLWPEHAGRIIQLICPGNRRDGETDKYKASTDSSEKEACAVTLHRLIEVIRF